MNRPITVIAVAALIMFAITAHLFRYEPLPLKLRGGTFPEVWDRWFQRICYVVGPESVIACSTEDLKRLAEKVSDTANKPTAKPKTKFEELRAAGFSDKEIFEWAEREKQRLKRSGMSDKEIEQELFGTK